MNADPRRPEKVQRYVPKTNNGSGQEDLTPDYMNILGQHQTTANITEAADKHVEASVSTEPNLQASCHLEEVQPVPDELAATINATNVIPTNPQYGVAIMSNPPIIPAANDIPTDTFTPPTETVTDTTAKPSDESKELHSTPSRNDRFKVVKIASLEPFKRGRWKCMDYVDEAPPAGAVRVPQSTGSIQMPGVPYMQTQSLPQHQIQQMLMQSGFANGTQFFQNMQPQMIPQGQYFYPQMTNIPNQTLPQQVPSSMPAQFINNQPYFPAGVVPNAAGFSIPQVYPNMQYIPANLMQTQGSAFVPTSQTVQIPASFQQGQTYTGQPSVSQSNIQSLVNGHNFTPQTEQQGTSSVPTQSVKSVILTSNVPQQGVSQTQLTQQNIQNHLPVQGNQSVTLIQGQQYQQAAYHQPIATQIPQSQNSSQVVQNVTPVQAQPGPQIVPIQSQTFDQSLPSNIYTNPQFPMNVNSLTVLDNTENPNDVNETNSGVDTMSESTDDLAKTNPVNAIDNKIEQAMDLVKSHLMYTVREEVEVLKEKIAELMERIQQLETENNYLRSQIPKNQSMAPPPTSSSNASTQPSVILTNPSPNYIPSSNATVVTPQTSTPVTNPSHNPIPNTQGHSMPTGDTLNTLKQ